MKDFLKKRQAFLEYTLREIEADLKKNPSPIEDRILSREKLVTEFLLEENKEVLGNIKEEGRSEPRSELAPGEVKYAHFVLGMKPTGCTVSLRHCKPFVKFEDGVNPPFMCDPWHPAIAPEVAEIAQEYFLDNYEWAPDECIDSETKKIWKMFWNEVRRDDGFAEELQLTRNKDGALNGFTFGRMANDESQIHRALDILRVSKLKEEGK